MDKFELSHFIWVPLHILIYYLMMAKDKRFHKNYINISKEKFAFIPPIILSVILSQTKGYFPNVYINIWWKNSFFPSLAKRFETRVFWKVLMDDSSFFHVHLRNDLCQWHFYYQFEERNLYSYKFGSIYRYYGCRWQKYFLRVIVI